MQGLFCPKSVCVFGVSTSPNNFGKNIVKNLLEFDFHGPIYAVGREESEIYGVRIYTSILQIEEPVDLAVFLIPAKTIPAMLEECGQKGIKRVVVSSGGFTELGDQRKDLEDQVVEIAKRYDMRFLGPNCIGIINQDVGLCLPFPRLKRFPTGPVSILAQSGGVSLSLIQQMAGENIGINKLVSLGNKLNVGEPELLTYLNGDESTKTICLYLEEIEKGRAMMDAMRPITKPIIIYKSNTTHQGALTAKSHTAAISSDDRVVDAALRQVGAIRVRDMNEMLYSTKAFQLPPLQGNRIAIISPTGGFAVIMADECEKAGFVLPPFPDDFIADIKKHVRAGVINLSNPLDLGDLFDMEMVAHTVMRALREPGIDALILGWIFFRDVGLGVTAGNAFPMLSKLMKIAGKPVAVCITGNPRDTAELKMTSPVPIFNSPEETVRALSVLHQHSINLVSRAEPMAVIPLPIDELNKALDNARGKQLVGKPAMDFLKLAGFNMVPYEFATSADAAAEAARKIGFPVAMKIESDDVLHKTDVGGVRLSLGDKESVKKAFEEMVAEIKKNVPDAKIDGVLIQAMAQKGRECLVGLSENPHFGPVVAFGLGGVMVEALEDVSLRVAPLTRHDAELMIDELRAKKLLGAFRGMKPADREAIIETLVRISSLALACPRISEMDINPLMVYEEGGGAVVVDCRILLKESAAD